MPKECGSETLCLTSLRAAILSRPDKRIQKTQFCVGQRLNSDNWVASKPIGVFSPRKRSKISNQVSFIPKIPVVLLLGVILSACGEDVGALRREIVALRSRNSELSTQVGNVQRKLSDCQSQAKQYQQGEQSKARKQEEAIALARGLLSQKRYDEAARVLEGLASGQVQRTDEIKSIAAAIVTIVVILLLIIGFIGMVSFIIVMVLQERDHQEIALRLLTLMIGFLVYFGASRLGISIPELLLSSLAYSNPYAYAGIAAVIPSIAGMVVCAFVIRTLRKGEIFAYRVVIFTSILVATLFLDVFVNAFAVGLNHATLSPNMFFVIGIGLYLIFRHGRVDPRPVQYAR